MGPTRVFHPRLLAALTGALTGALIAAGLAMPANAEDEPPATGEHSGRTVLLAQAETLPEDEAQDFETAESSEGQRKGGIEEIVVTAERRETLAQSTPVAISAFSGGDLDAQGYYDFEDISFNVPNVQFGRNLVSTGGFTIRGVSSSAGDPATAFHQNGIYVNFSTAAEGITFFDIERVEVLRGPQGTLYGRNATGGSLNVVSNPPSNEFEAFGDIQFGTYDEYLLRTGLNVPIVDGKVLSRFAFLLNNRDGYQRNLFTNRASDNANDADDLGVRSQLKFLPSDSVDLTLRYNYGQQRGVGNGFKVLGDNPTAVTVGGNFLTDQYCASVQARQQTGCFVPQNPSNNRDIYLDFVGKIDNWSHNANFEGNWDVPDLPLFGETRATLRGSWLQLRTFGRSDQDGSSQELVDVFTTVPSTYSVDANGNLVFQSGCDTTAFANGATVEEAGCDDGHNEATEWVLEAQWASAGSSDLEWVVGFFYLNTSGRTAGLAATFPLPFILNPPLGDALSFLQTPVLTDSTSSDISYAGFGQASYSFGEDTDTIWDNFTPTLGLRYTWDSKKATRQTPRVDVLGSTIQGQINTEDQQGWGAVTGVARIDWNWSDDSLAYITASRGYKAGFINTALANPAISTVSVPNADPEYIWALEGGSKNRFFDNRLQVNVTGFWYDYDDLQVTTLFNISTVTQNAAKATVWGFEGEFVALPLEGWTPSVFEPLTLILNVGYLNATYDTFEGCLLPEMTTVAGFMGDPVIDCTGNTPVRAPPYTVTAILNWPIDLGRFGTLTPNLQFYASGKVFYRPTNCPNSRCDQVLVGAPRGVNDDFQSPYQIFDLRLTWTSSDQRLEVAGFVNNVFDKDVIQSQVTGSSQIGAPIQVLFDRPRTAGVRLAFNW